MLFGTAVCTWPPACAPQELSEKGRKKTAAPHWWHRQEVEDSVAVRSINGAFDGRLSHPTILPKMGKPVFNVIRVCACIHPSPSMVMHPALDI